jgi:hypothetical protein
MPDVTAGGINQAGGARHDPDRGAIAVADPLYEPQVG